MNINIGNKTGKLTSVESYAGKDIACKPLSRIARSLRQVIPLVDNEAYVADLKRFLSEHRFSLELE